MRFYRTLTVLVATLLAGGIVALARPALATDNLTDWLPVDTAAGEPVVIGAVDSPRAGEAIAGSAPLAVHGWVADLTATDSAGIVEVQLFVRAPDGSEQPLAAGAPDQPRPDVPAATGRAEWLLSGYAFEVASDALPSGEMTLLVYVQSATNGWWVREVPLVGPSGSAGEPAFQPVATPEPAPTASWEDQVVALVNRERQTRGLGPLTTHPALARAARDYAQVLASTGCFGHTCGPVPDLGQRARQAGYIGGLLLGENIAAVSRTPEEVMAGWMGSAGHRDNILRAGFRETGVGIARGGEYGIYWVQEFGG